MANYDFGDSVRVVDPALAIRYFQRSLGKEITDEEVGALQQRYPTGATAHAPGLSIGRNSCDTGPKKNLQPRINGRPSRKLAQPLIEELIGSQADDLMSQKDYSLAGAVQAGSGAAGCRN